MTGFCNRDLTLYSPVVNIFTNSLILKIPHSAPHSVFMSFVWI